MQGLAEIWRGVGNSGYISVQGLLDFGGRVSCNRCSSSGVGSDFVHLGLFFRALPGLSPKAP